MHPQSLCMFFPRLASVLQTLQKVALFSLFFRIFVEIKLWIMYFTGIIIGVATFLIIGLFHPIVIKSEYYFGVKCWWVFAVMGVATLVSSLMVENVLISTLLAVWGASSLWSIGELFEQRERVRKGWFPKREK